MMRGNQSQILTKFNMAKEGYEVSTAFDGKEARKCLRQNSQTLDSGLDAAKWTDRKLLGLFARLVMCRLLQRVC